MIRLAPALGLIILSVTGCSSASPANNAAAAAPQPKPTGPPPLTPKMSITPAPGESPAWLGARSDHGAPETAPYGNLLDQPVVNGASAR